MDSEQPDSAQERERLRCLQALNVLDTDAEPVFDALVAAAAAICDCPIALISLVDAERQWFKAAQGLDGVTETPREYAFCDHAIRQDDVLIIPNALEDARFCDNPLVLGEPDIRFYAGAPIIIDDTQHIGTLCVIDRKPRDLTPAQCDALAALSAAATAALTSQRRNEVRMQSAEQIRERLSWLYKSTPAMLHSVDAAGRITHVSDAWLRCLGYTAGEVIGRDSTDFLTPESAQYAKSVVLPAFFGAGRCDNIEYQMLHKDGHVVEVRLSATLERDDEQKPLWSVAVLEDVTAQKRAEQRLMRSRDRMQSILDGTNVGTWEWNVKTGETRFNDRWAEIIGYQLHELMPVSIETWTGVTHPDDLANSFELIEKHFRGEADFYDCDCRVRHRDGHWVWVRDRGRVAEWDKDGNPVWMMGTHTDITERRAADEALLSHQRSLERTGQIAKVGGWTYTFGSDAVEWSDQTCRIYDLAPGSAITPEQSLSFYGEQARATLSGAFRAGLSEGLPWDLELPMTTAAGRAIWVHIVGEVVRESDGTVQLVGAIQDITRRHQAERELEESRELLQVTLDSIGDAVITTDLHGAVRWLNPVAERLTGWSNEDAGNRPVSEVFRIIDEDTREPAADPIKRCLKEGKIGSLADNSVLIARDGSEWGIKDSASPIRGRDGQVLGVVLVFHDVSEQRRMSREMGYRATHDTLTGLVNRSEFEARLSQVLEQSRKQPRDNALMYIDLDQFKIVNDSCGHAVGDRLLQEVSAIMTNCVRNRDTLARLGGDEFGVILEHCTVEQAQRVAQKICDCVNEYRLLHEGKPYRVGTSIGLVPISETGALMTSVLKAADSACYAAKEAGRNRVHVWREKDHTIRERQGEMKWASRIEQALDEDRFVLYAQHIVPLRKSISGQHFEILVRIRDDEGNLTSPGAFLPAAERYHLASRIDRWVVQNTFRSLESRAIDVGSIATISINLSGQSIGDQVFHRFLADMIESAKFDVGKLCLEITETAAITHIGQAQNFIGDMRDLGIRIALDDFGAGASSFGYLKSLPVHFLKIDGQFVRGLMSDPLNLAAIRCFVEVARVVGIQTVAEFVEQQEEVSQLAELGVDYGQGYLLHKPEPLADVLRLSPIELSVEPDAGGAEVA